MFSLAFLEFGTLWFWLILACAVILITVFSEDSPFKATLVAVVFLGGMSWLGNITPLALITQHGMIAILVIMGYFALGVIWSLIKWKFYVMAQRRKLNEFQILHNKLIERRREKKEDVSPAVQAELWENLLRQNDNSLWRVLTGGSLSSQTVTVAPQASAHKSQIVGWMAYWPVSLVWTMIDDPVRRAFLALYDVAGKTYQKIANNDFRDIDPKEPWKTKEEAKS
jgi:hypothetical protein